MPLKKIILSLNNQKLYFSEAVEKIDCLFVLKLIVENQKDIGS